MVAVEENKNCANSRGKKKKTVLAERVGVQETKAVVSANFLLDGLVVPIKGS